MGARGIQCHRYIAGRFPLDELRESHLRARLKTHLAQILLNTKRRKTSKERTPSGHTVGM